MNDFIDLKSLLPRALEKYKLARQAQAATVCERFREIAPSIVGEDCLNEIKAKYFKGHVLYIGVPSSVWAQRVYVHRHDILMKLNLDNGKELVHDIQTLVE